MSIPAGVLTQGILRAAFDALWNPGPPPAPVVPPGPVGEVLREWYAPRPSPPVAQWHAEAPDRHWEVAAGGWKLIVVSGAIRGIVGGGTP